MTPLQTNANSGPRSSKGVKTRARLLDAAKHVFEESGFLEARISDIADRAGNVTIGLLVHVAAWRLTGNG